MKVAIIGTRRPLIEYDEWERIVLNHIDLTSLTEIISGGAIGIDSYAKRFAESHNIPLTEYVPQYALYGRRAALLRNVDIVQVADMIIAFPTSESRGTYHALREARRLNKAIIEILI